MPTEAKRETVAELRDELSRSRTLIVSEYRGLKVKEIAEIRRALRQQDVRYRVVKNRLMRIAAAGRVGDALNPLLIGPSAIAFGQRRGGDGQSRHRRDPPVQPDRPDHGRRPRRPRDRRRRRDPARSAPGPRGPPRQAGRRHAGAGGQLAGLFAAPLRNLGYALQQVAEQKAAGRKRVASETARPTEPNRRTLQGDDIAWQP